MGRTILGIDPGLDGGLVLLDESGHVLEKHLIPTISAEKEKRKRDKKTGEMKSIFSKNRNIDIIGLNKIFVELAPKVNHVILEQVNSRPGMAAQVVFKFGKVVGIIEALIVSREMAFTTVIPASWCKVIHAGIPGDEPKDRSRIALGRLFPKVDLRSSDRASKPHEGLMDALLLAEWGRRKMLAGEL